MDTARHESETVPVTDAIDAIDAIAFEAIGTPPSAKNNREIRHSPTGPEPTEPEAVDVIVGNQIGPYQVAAWIGGSPIGNVYRATRPEECAEHVAIKLFKHAMDRDLVLRRFQTETHLQSALGKHPNITALLDAGTTDDRRPYFVMEYVQGQHIDQFCDDRRLDLPARLRLFAQVCQAVHFGHQHAVIHRDLKPSNILITADGVPKIIDFGIVGLLQPEADDGQAVTSMKAMLTCAGEPVLTPEYASPEQVKGDVVTTASDVYSLGVVLYQLVSGRKPYRLTSRNTSEVFRAICEQVPEKPSTAIIHRPARRPAASADLLPSSPPGSAPKPFSEPAPLPVSLLPPTPDEIASARSLTPRGLRRSLAGDLDLIVLMALRKEPEGRYSSAEQLGDDLHRYLMGIPVRAHRDSRAYRTNKFVRRHAVAVTAGGFILLALVAGIIATTKGLVTIRRERDRTEDSFRQARHVIDQLFTQISENRLLNQPGMHRLRRALVLDAQRFYEDFLKQQGADPKRQAELATARTRIAKITSLTGSATKAITQYHEAIKLWEKLAAANPANLDYQASLAQTLSDLGTVVMPMDGRLDEALETFRQAQNTMKLLISADPESVSQRLELGLVLHNIAEIQRRRGKPDEAITSIEQALSIESQLAAEGPQSLELQIALANAHAMFGRLLGAQPAELLPAIAAYHQAIELHEVVTREHPELAELSYQLASELSDLSSLQQKLGQIEPAVGNLHRASRIFEQIVQFSPGIVSYQHGLGTTYNMLSNLERLRGERAEAFRFAQKACSLFGRLVTENPKNNDFRRDLTKSHNNLGRLHEQAGDPVEALRSFQHAVDLFESLQELDPQDSFNLACNAALCIPLIGAKRGQHDTSQELSKADQLRRQFYGNRAIEALRRAADGGFLSPQSFHDETDLNSLRARVDFQALSKNVEEKQAIQGK